MGSATPAASSAAKGSGGQSLPATIYGTPEGSTGYPASGDLGGTITATHIHKLKVGSANVLAQTAQNASLIQSVQLGYPTYAVSPGYAWTNAVIATSGSIDKVDVTGTPLNTEIKTGFDYASFVAGQEGTRAASRIARLKLRGDLINSDISATVRPVNNHYNRQDERQRQRLDHRHRDGTGDRHQRDDGPRQHGLGRLREASQGTSAGDELTH